MAGNLSILRDESGAAMVEFTVTFLLFITVLFGVIEFSYAFYQWNAATKAMQKGARYAAVSDPIMAELPDISGLRKVNGVDVTAGSPYAGSYLVVCSGSTATCTCTGAECSVINNNTYVAAAMTAVVNVMSQFYPRIQASNVTVTYEYTGLGYAGRPGGPAPTITVSLSGLNFEFILLSGILGTNSVPMPSFATTVTGEDIKSAGS